MSTPPLSIRCHTVPMLSGTPDVKAIMGASLFYDKGFLNGKEISMY